MRFALRRVTSEDCSVPRSNIADEIRGYCCAHPDALDSLNGIAWWVAMQRYDDVLDELASVVDALVDEGVLVRHRTQDGTIVFGCCVKSGDFVS